MTLLTAIIMLLAFALTIILVSRGLEWVERRPRTRAPARRAPLRDEDAREVGLF
ncbi:MAG: hypothetical protein AAFN79_05585 [Pseudomonadota bacterium]